MTRKAKIFVGGLVAAGLVIGLVETPNSKVAKADFGTTFIVGVASAIVGKFAYDRFFKNHANHGAALDSSDPADRQCAFAFPSYDPGTGLYVDHKGKKKVCPFLISR